REVTTATRSAEKAWEAKNDEEANTIARLKGFPGAGYNISNTKLIDWLDITEEEQRHLETIIAAPEKRRRNRDRTREYQREKRGSVTRKKYLDAQKGKTEDMLFLLEKAMKKHPNAKGKELAELLGVTPARISQLKKAAQKLNGCCSYIRGVALRSSYLKIFRGLNSPFFYSIYWGTYPPERVRRRRSRSRNE